MDVEAISIEGGDLLARAGSPPPSVRTSWVPRLRHDCRGRSGVSEARGRRPCVTLNMAGSHAPNAPFLPFQPGLSPTARRRKRRVRPVAFGTAQECLFTAGHLEPTDRADPRGSRGVGMAATESGTTSARAS